MSEFYGEKVEPGVTDPGLDPPLTVRIQPPNTQARRLDITTPRVVRFGGDEGSGPWPWIVITGPPSNTTRLHNVMSNDEVRDWPVEHPVTIGAAQRLAQGREAASAGPAREILGDEDEELPFKDKGKRS